MNKQEIEKAIEQLKGDIAYHKAVIARNTDYPEYCKKEQLYIDTLNMTISALEHQLTNGWIPISERLPENENPVEVTARRKDGARGYFIYKACYVAPHTQTTEDYGWDCENIDAEYDEEHDCFWVPECWYEDNAISDNGNYIIDGEFDILAWKPLTEPWKELPNDRSN